MLAHLNMNSTKAVQLAQKASTVCVLTVQPDLSYVETSIVAVPEGLALPTGICAASRTLAIFDGLAQRPATLGSLGRLCE